MQRVGRLDALRTDGKIAWSAQEHGWLAEPDEVLGALSAQGYVEYKRETTWRRPQGAVAGIWEALDPTSGRVVSVSWRTRSASAPTVVFVDVDGEPIEAA